jgi:hypothetical protein
VTPPALSIVIARSAARQVQEAHRWWRANRAAAPNAIIEELERGLRLISLQPGIGIVARSKRLTSVRRVCLTRIS